MTALLPQLSFRDKLMLLRIITLDLTSAPESSAAQQQQQQPVAAPPQQPAVAPPQPQTQPQPQPQTQPQTQPQQPVAAPEAVPKAKAPKKASGGTMAWMSFVKHCQDTQPSRFADSKDRGHVLSVAKEIRHEDEDAYKSFVADWRTDEETEAEDEAPPAPAPKPKKAKAAKAKEADAEGGDAEPKAKRPANPGILAFTAYSKHLMETQPQLFTEAKSHGDKLKIVSQTSKDSKESYESFVGEWKSAHNFSAAANYLKASPPFAAAVGGGGAAAAAAATAAE